MKQRMAFGKLKRETLVWKSGMPNWLPAGAVAELFGPVATLRTVGWVERRFTGNLCQW